MAFLFFFPFFLARMLWGWVRKKEAKLIFDKLTLDSIKELECLTRVDVEKGEGKENVNVNN